jgi:signal transduction histidine kinase
MATRAKPRPAKKNEKKKKPARAAASRTSESRPSLSRPPRTSPDEHEAKALRLFAEIENVAGSDARALAERAAEQVLESFVRKLGHDQVKHLGGLYSASYRLAELLRKPELDRAALAANAEMGTQSVRRLHRLIERMRDAVLLTKRHLNEELVAPLVEEVRATVVSELGPRAARFDFKTDVEEGLKLHADHPFLLRALTELVKNAAEGYPESSPLAAVRLTARTRGRTVEIVVADDGYGWDADTIPYAFVPFSTSKPAGTGLGLYLARRDVEELHGGRLTLESDGRGRGTRVRVVLLRRHDDVHPRRRLTLDEMHDEAARRERAEAGLS